MRCSGRNTQAHRDCAQSFVAGPERRPWCQEDGRQQMGVGIADSSSEQASFTDAVQDLRSGAQLGLRQFLQSPDHSLAIDQIAQRQFAGHERMASTDPASRSAASCSSRARRWLIQMDVSTSIKRAPTDVVERASTAARSPQQGEPFRAFVLNQLPQCFTHQGRLLSQARQCLCLGQQVIVQCNGRSHHKPLLVRH